MCTSPNCLGMPCTQPRIIGTGWSTQAKGQRAIARPSNSQASRIRNSEKRFLAGSVSSSPESEHHCQSAKTAAAAPMSGPGLSPGGRKAAAAPGSTR